MEIKHSYKKVKKATDVWQYSICILCIYESKEWNGKHMHVMHKWKAYVWDDYMYEKINGYIYMHDDAMYAYMV